MEFGTPQNLFGAEIMLGIESPFPPELEQLLWDPYEALVRLGILRECVLEVLEVRFGTVPAEPIAAINAVTDEARLRAFHRLAITCPDFDTFLAGLTAEATAKVRIAMLREDVIAALEIRFGSVPADRLTPLNAVTDEPRLRALFRLAITCPDVDTFLAGLAGT